MTVPIEVQVEVPTVAESVASIDRCFRLMGTLSQMHTELDEGIRELARRLSLERAVAHQSGNPESIAAADKAMDDAADAYSQAREFHAKVGAAYIAFREAERATISAAFEYGTRSQELKVAEDAFEMAEMAWKEIVMRVEADA